MSTTPDPAQIAAMARNATIEATNRIINAKGVDLDQTLADIEQLITVQQDAVDAIEAHLDALHACRAVYQYGDHRQVSESLERERQALERLQRSQRGLLRVKTQRNKEA